MKLPIQKLGFVANPNTKGSIVGLLPSQLSSELFYSAKDCNSHLISPPVNRQDFDLVSSIGPLADCKYGGGTYSEGAIICGAGTNQICGSDDKWYRYVNPNTGSSSC